MELDRTPLKAAIAGDDGDVVARAEVVDGVEICPSMTKAWRRRSQNGVAVVVVGGGGKTRRKTLQAAASLLESGKTSNFWCKNEAECPSLLDDVAAVVFEGTWSRSGVNRGDDRRHRHTMGKT